MTIKRRQFLGHMAASGAVLTMPAFLQGCGVQSATAVSQATPENPFMSWFGVDQAGADHADQVVGQETPRPPEYLEVAAEHPQAEHVEGDVSQAAVEEPVGQQLPERKG